MRQVVLQPGPPARQADAPGPDDGNAYAVSEGKRLYNQMNCSGCHVQGGGGIGPPLMDAAWIYGSAPRNIFETIVEGRPNGMPSFGGKLGDDQVWQLVAYVRSMSGLVAKDVGERPERRHAGAEPGAVDPEGLAAAERAAQAGGTGAAAMSVMQHSALDPAGPQAALIRDALWHPMSIIAAVTFVLVVAALAWAVLRRRRADPHPEEEDAEGRPRPGSRRGRSGDHRGAVRHPGPVDHDRPGRHRHARATGRCRFA